MFFERKTKTQNILKSIWFPFLSLGIFFSAFGLYGPGPAFYTLGGIYFLASIFPIVTFLKTRNNGYLAVALFQIFAGLVFISAPPAIENKNNLGLLPILMVIMYGLLMVVANQVFIEDCVGGEKKSLSWQLYQ